MFPEAKTLVQNVKEYFVKPPDPKELVRKWQARAMHSSPSPGPCQLFWAPNALAYDIRFTTAPWACKPGKLPDGSSISCCPLCSLTYGESSDRSTRPSETMIAWRRLPRNKSRKPQSGTT